MQTFLILSGGCLLVELCYTVPLPSSYRVSLVIFNQHSSTGQPTNFLHLVFKARWFFHIHHPSITLFLPTAHPLPAALEFLTSRIKWCCSIFYCPTRCTVPPAVHLCMALCRDPKAFPNLRLLSSVFSLYLTCSKL